MSRSLAEDAARTLDDQCGRALEWNVEFARVRVVSVVGAFMQHHTIFGHTLQIAAIHLERAVGAQVSRLLEVLATSVASVTG